MIDVSRVVEQARHLTSRSFASRDLVVLERDGFVLVVLAEDLVAYVPTDDVHRLRLATQRKVLARVAPRVSFAVPRPIGPLDLDGDVDLRTPAPGMTGPEHHARLMRDAQLAARAGEWMGRALAELHAALAPSELHALAVPRPTWPLPLADLARNVDARLEGRSRDAAYAAIERWRALPASPDVLVHGDFASHNFAFDSETGLPTGVFDFYDGGRGPRALDFALLPSYGHGVVERAREAYGPDAPAIEEIRLVHAVSAIAYLSTKTSAVEWVKSALSAAGFSIL